MYQIHACSSKRTIENWILRGPRSSSFWFPRNLSHHMIRQARTGDTVLVRSREMIGRRQVLPRWLAGDGAKTTGNKIQWPRWKRLCGYSRTWKWYSWIGFVKKSITTAYVENKTQRYIVEPREREKIERSPLHALLGDVINLVGLY